MLVHEIKKIEGENRLLRFREVLERTLRFLKSFA